MLDIKSSVVSLQKNNYPVQIIDEIITLQLLQEVIYRRVIISQKVSKQTVYFSRDHSN